MDAHYSSPRLRREGKEETIEFIEKFRQMVNTMVVARRGDTKGLAKDLDKAKKEVEKAKEEILKKDELLEELRAKLAEIEKQTS